MMSFRAQTSWAKMTSLGYNLTAPACHVTKKVNKAEQRTYNSTNFAYEQADFSTPVIYTCKIPIRLILWYNFIKYFV